MSVPRVFIDGLEKEHVYQGETLHWRPTIHGFAVQDKQVFLVRPYGSTILEPPGGKIELGESASQTLEREFLEEAGYAVRPIRLLNFAEKWFFHQREEKYYHMVMQIWQVELGKKLREPSDPHEFAGFLPLSELKKEQFHQVMGETIEFLQQTAG